MTNDVLQQLVNQLKKSESIISQLKVAEAYDSFHEAYSASNEKIEVSLKAINEEIKELESQVRRAEERLETLNQEISTTADNNSVYEGESNKREELIENEQRQFQEIKEENLKLEQSIAELNETLEKEAAPNVDHLRSALYRGLGVEAVVDGREEKIVITSQAHDIRTVSLENNTKNHTANYIWEFISK